jgi:hypothetical protein
LVRWFSLQYLVLIFRPHPGYVVDDVTDETRDKDLQDVKNEPPVEDPHKDLPMDNKPVSHEETPKYTKDVPDYVYD